MTGPVQIGRIGADPVHAVTLTNRHGLRARLISYGARLTELHVPDRAGRMADIVLGFDSLAEYLATDTYFGATCGRYGNRIADGRFVLDGVGHQLTCNENGNHLHGGPEGFDRKNWAIDQLSRQSVTFGAVSAAGEMGYPGQCTLRSSYALTDDNRLTLTLEAETTKATPMNMVHHSYFNLGGQGSGDVLGHHMQIAARFYTPVDDALLATGEIRSVTGTPFDFTTAKPIGRDIAGVSSDADNLLSGPLRGYDHNWCLDGSAALHPAVVVHDPVSGRRMTLTTTEPGLQFYIGGHLPDDLAGKAGLRLGRFAGLTLETQKFPGSPQFSHFPSCILRPGDTYRQRMEFAFDTDNDPSVAD